MSTKGLESDRRLTLFEKKKKVYEKNQSITIPQHYGSIPHIGVLGARRRVGTPDLERKDERAESGGGVWLEEKQVLAVTSVHGGGSLQVEPDTHGPQD